MKEACVSEVSSCFATRHHQPQQKAVQVSLGENKSAALLAGVQNEQDASDHA